MFSRVVQASSSKGVVTAMKQGSIASALSGVQLGVGVGQEGIVRKFSVSVASEGDIDASRLEIELTKSPKTKLPNDQLLFGKTFTDHMLEVDYVNGGWDAPKISPYHNFSMDPATTVLHYGLECFEGMKAYIDKEDNIRMFRPMDNMHRMNASGQRLALPGFNGEEFLKCIKELLKVDKEWIPKEKGYSLYLRPTYIGMEPSLGVAKSEMAKLFVIQSPVGPYFAEGFKPVKLLATSEMVRAWPGGTGNAKVGGNYGPTILAQDMAAKEGCQQILWLFKNKQEEDEVTEVGTMNMFVYWKNEDGDDELITPPLDGTILPGVTRQSILDLSREWGEFKVTERFFTMKEMVNALEQGRVYESFGAGTACVVAPIESIKYNNVDYDVPIDRQVNAGPLTKRFLDTVMGIQYGEIERPDWSIVVA